MMGRPPPDSDDAWDDVLGREVVGEDIVDEVLAEEAGLEHPRRRLPLLGDPAAEPDSEPDSESGGPASGGGETRSVDAVLGPGSPLARRLPGYEQREGQLEM